MLVFCNTSLFLLFLYYFIIHTILYFLILVHNFQCCLPTKVGNCIFVFKKSYRNMSCSVLCDDSSSENGFLKECMN